MSKVWPRDVIRELLALAECKGEARAKLSSPREAELFRFAIYDFRDRHDIGKDTTVIIDNDEVVVKKKPMPIVHILQRESI